MVEICFRKKPISTRDNQQTSTGSKSTIKTLEEGVKYGQS